MDCSLPVSSVHGILRQEYWSALLLPSRGDLPNQPRDQTHVSCVSCIDKWILYHYTTREAPKIIFSLHGKRDSQWNNFTNQQTFK